MTRPSWDAYFLSLAREVSLRATCPRLAVGCLLVRDKQILSTGYNGSVRGMPHCCDIGCDVRDGHCQRTVHAETNALLQAARSGTRIEDCTAYVNYCPCFNCLKHLINAGVRKICYSEEYGDCTRQRELAFMTSTIFDRRPL